ncbi:MAG: FAD-dependent oxidoreductase [Spirochaetes bacterium]|nr:FAD-dependent oxidoreductase [Spirochaetota bacterium]
MRDITHEADFCVVGGGMAGLSAAIAAARHGARTVLVQDRPVLGGNASSEIRMWICGAHNENNDETGRVDPEGGDNNHETGIIEEILLENQWRNTWPNYSVWDSILYEKARFQGNLVLLLNTYASEVEVAEGAGKGRRIVSVTGRQMTTESRVVVRAKLFSDCTGNGLVGALAGAEFRIGREARAEFGESIAPEVADRHTMGLSCLIEARETDRSQSFIAPSWAYRYDSDREMPQRAHRVEGRQNFWWLEVGGMADTIHDNEELRDELLKIAFGVWDHIKNRGDHGAGNWALDWVGFLPGKRESRRFVGDHILCQGDVEDAGRHFEDIVGYGGWTMDDHFPEGFYRKEAGTIFHPAPSPYGIPYRCLYSRNVDNLFFAGRNISTTHCALSSTRVQATCSTLGQAVGTAAAIAVRNGLSPRGVCLERLAELKQSLMEDDCYLPFNRREINALTRSATLSASRGDPEKLRNGLDRQIGSERNSWDARVGDSVVFDFGAPVQFSGIRLVFDSDLNRTTRNMVSYYTMASQDFAVPPSIVKSFSIEAQGGQAGEAWRKVVDVVDNHQRLVRLPLGLRAARLRFTARETWGAEAVRVFAIDLY